MTDINKRRLALFDLPREGGGSPATLVLVIPLQISARKKDRSRTTVETPG